MPTPVRRRISHYAKGLARSGPTYLLEVVVFWLIIEAVDQSGYGHPSATFAPVWYPLVSLVIVGAAMGAGEARFRLYGRVWSVAGLSDAFAVGLAVVESPLPVIIVNLPFPDGHAPFRVLSPVLAAPPGGIAVGLVALLPPLPSRAA